MEISKAATSWAFRHLHKRGIVRAVNSCSSSNERASVTMRFETWPRVPAWAVGHFADHHFAELYPSRARTFYRKSIEHGPVTVSGRRIWIIGYAPSINSLADAFRNLL